MTVTGTRESRVPAAASASAAARPFVSVVVLTRNERDNIGDCLRAFLAEPYGPFEVLVVDAASTDGTPDEVRAIAAADGGDRVRLIDPGRLLSVGEARNLGLREARGDVVAFVSADAYVAPGWFGALAKAMDGADVVFGRQEHAPPERTPVAAVRSLRYHHFMRDPPLEPLAYASNVNSAWRREVLESIPVPEDRHGSMIDDVLVARRAAAAGHRVAYSPRMLVRHKDVTTFRGEMAKNRREGEALGRYRGELGPQRLAEAWGVALAVAAGGFVLFPGLTAGLLLAAVAYAPTLRRVAAARDVLRGMDPRALIPGVLAGPLFDLRFLVSYVNGAVMQR